eukprot:621020-Pyramimonas_sp.AAC.1
MELKEVSGAGSVRHMIRHTCARSHIHATHTVRPRADKHGRAARAPLRRGQTTSWGLRAIQQSQ